MPKFNPDPSISYTVAEVIALQKTDQRVCERYRGAPIVRKYAQRDFLGLPIRKVTDEDFQPVLSDYLAGRPSKETGLRLISDFNALMRWATQNDFRSAPHHPFKVPAPTPRKIIPFSMDFLETILSVADDMYRNDNTVAIAIRALALLGLGVNDAANFSLDRVDFKNWEYTQDDAAGRLRVIPIPINMRAQLGKARHLQSNGGTHKPKGPAWISCHSIRVIVHRIGLKCGLPDLTPVQITHTCVFG
jgi:hypothetical protein